MSTTKLVREFLYDVSTTLQDITPQFTRWPEAELVVYTNYGQMAIAKYLPQAVSRVDAIRLQAGSRQDITTVAADAIVPGDGSSPELTYGLAVLDVYRNMGSNGATPGRTVRIVDRYPLDTVDPDWMTAARAESAVKEVIYDARLPRVFFVHPPVPTTGQVWVEMAWVPEPKRIPPGNEPGNERYAKDGTDPTLLGIPDQLVDDLHHYVVAVALLKGSKNVQNVPKAQLHAGIFNNSLNAQATALGGTSPNLKALPFLNQIQGGA